MLVETCARVFCVAVSKPTVIEPLLVTGPPLEVIPVPAVTSTEVTVPVPKLSVTGSYFEVVVLYSRT